MGTRAVIRFEDDAERFHVYSHYDGDAEGVADMLVMALPFAWPQPRFEADDFSTAFIAGNKPLNGGAIYMSNGVDSHDDLEYWYRVTQSARNNQMIIEAYQVVYENVTGHSYGSKKHVRFFYGRLKDFIGTYGSERSKTMWDTHVPSQHPLLDDAA